MKEQYLILTKIYISNVSALNGAFFKGPGWLDIHPGFIISFLAKMWRRVGVFCYLSLPSVSTYAHTRRHTLEIRNASKLLRLTKFSSRLRYSYYIQEKEEVTHQKNKPIVTQFVHICFSQCEKNVPDFGQIRISCIQTFRMGG